MPRPSKHVSPDTLGGRIRAARERLHLSLAEVAGGHYSPSLISQIERNRIEPSQESLSFLAKRLKLPLEDLQILVQQNRSSDLQSNGSDSYAALLVNATQLLANNEICHALTALKELFIPDIPPSLRWRLMALRGHCYFALRKFFKAEQDFAYAVCERPEPSCIPAEQRHDLLLLHLHLAETYRELRQPDDALEQYYLTLTMMNSDTPSGYVAEANWGIAVILLAQIKRFPLLEEPLYRSKLLVALEYAENARFLYRSIGERFQTMLVTCQIAEIEQWLGNIEKARVYLQEVLSRQPVPGDESATGIEEKRMQQREANVHSTAACRLAEIELEAGNHSLARQWVEFALEASKRGYKIRRAQAYSTLSRILEAIDPRDPAVEEALRRTTNELADTDRIAARISAHVRLGRHLLKVGKTEEGEVELEQARLLSDIVSAHDNSLMEEVGSVLEAERKSVFAVSPSHEEEDTCSSREDQVPLH
ncbi:MAG: helix-turn-helix transcriptional regulator [Ktedonobacteraceae bacterium]|nr:helix-turn-helix transcriptional regulator [Ktedonobacteraceae bacterium]